MQRNGDSAELLERLAIPQVLEREQADIAVQSALATKIEEAIAGVGERADDLKLEIEALIQKENGLLAKRKVLHQDDPQRKELDRQIEGIESEVKGLNEKVSAIPRWDRPELFLGTIQIERLPTSEDRTTMLQEAVDAATFVSIDPSPTAPRPERAFRPSAIGNTGYDIIAKVEGVKELVVRNTLSTMIQAGQLDYLRKAGFVGEDKGWKLWIEVHYVRDRNPVPSGMHKDTLGQTLFVNLNYQNPAPITGPEYILNPAPSERHDREVGENGTLPEKFQGDLRAIRERLGQHEVIEAPEITAPYSAVAFVDEAIHHMTPVLEHRTVTGQGLREFLEGKYPEAAKAYDAWKAQRLTWWSFASYLPKGVPQEEAERWWKLLTRAEKLTSKYSRIELSEAGMTGDDIEELLFEKGPEGFRGASIPSVTQQPSGGRTPLRHPGQERPLRRRLSMRLLQAPTLAPTGTGGNSIPAQAPKRAFFRTWVRAVPRR